MANTNTTIQGFQTAKRKFLYRNADPKLRAALISQPVRAWPKRLRRMYKASRRRA